HGGQHLAEPASGNATARVHPARRGDRTAARALRRAHSSRRGMSARLTKFSHSCVRFDDGDRSLVIDPGTLSETDVALDGAGGVLITHEHPDHLDVGAVRSAAGADPRLRIWAPSGVAASLADLGEQVVAVAPGESFDAIGF